MEEVVGSSPIRSTSTKPPRVNRPAAISFVGRVRLTGFWTRWRWSVDAALCRVRRRAEAAVRVALADTPVVCAVGAPQVGKTTLVKGIDRRRVYIMLDDLEAAFAARLDPRGCVEAMTASGKSLTIDEVQRAPSILIAIKASVDVDRRAGRSFKGGVVLYSGPTTYPLGEKNDCAAPVSLLWDR